MNEISSLVWPLIAGTLLGILFFGGLWFTVKKVVAAKIPALWVFGSFFFRVSVVLIGFYFIGSSNWQRLLACTIGFIIARFIVIYYTKSIDAKKMQLKKEAELEA